MPRVYKSDYETQKLEKKDTTSDFASFSIFFFRCYYY